MCRGPAISRVATDGTGPKPSFPDPLSSVSVKMRSSPLSGTAVKRPSGEKGTWCGLAPVGAVRAGLAGEGEQVGERAEPAVVQQRQGGHGARGVVGDHQETVGRVHREVCGVAAAGLLAVQGGEPAAARVHAVGADVGEVAVHRVQEAPGAIGGQERRIVQFDRLEQWPVVAVGWHDVIVSVDYLIQKVLRSEAPLRLLESP